MNNIIDEASFLSETRRWKTEDVMTLANHFHKLCPNTHQHKRVHHFKMSAENVQRFSDFDEVKEINIAMALSEERNRSAFTFYPILEITLINEDRKKYLSLSPMEAPEFIPTPVDSDIVPGIFKEMISANWHNLEAGLIDDLFLAKKKTEEGEPLEMVRVHHFKISPKMIQHINLLRAEGLHGIYLYPGVDLNKFGDKAHISFTPILGLKHNERETTTLDQHGVIESGRTETFIEYSRPCPPTCK